MIYRIMDKCIIDMTKYLISCFFVVLLAACKSTPYSDETTKSDLRAPAYPLLTLHPHVKLWSMTDELNKQNMTFGGSTQLPFVGFLRVDGAMYRFMGSKELPMQAIAPMALDHENPVAPILHQELMK